MFSDAKNTSTQRRRAPICTYCGERDGTTRDHVPPKGLFGKPRPNLVTVPCCEPCRTSQSLDDEYFVRMISMKSDTAKNSSAKTARDSALRSLTKPAKRRFAQALISSTEDVALFSPSGIYVGQGMSYRADLKRLSKVIEITTCGLYRHKLGERLDDAHRCKVYALDGFYLATSDITAQLQRLWEQAISGEREDFGQNVFTYWFRRIDGPEVQHCGVT